MNKAQFFKYLSEGGAVRMITWHGEALPSDHKLAQVRTVTKVQSNAVQFNDGSWLYKNDVKASDVHDVHAGRELPAVSIGWAVYQLEKAVK